MTSAVVGMRVSPEPPLRKRGFSGSSPSNVVVVVGSTSVATVHPTTTTTDSSPSSTTPTNKFAMSSHEDDSSSLFAQQQRVNKSLGPIPWTFNNNNNFVDDDSNKQPIPHRRSLSSSVFDSASPSHRKNNSRLSKSPIKKHVFGAAGSTSSPTTTTQANFHQSRLLLETSFQNNNNSSQLNSSTLSSRGVSFQNPYSPKPMVNSSLLNNNNKSSFVQDQHQQEEEEEQETNADNNKNIENNKKREHEKTFLVYVKQLKSDLDHERELVKQLLSQEREFQHEKQAIAKERTQHRTEMKQLTDKLFLARREADIKERDLQKSLNDMQAWRRLAEESRVRERELEYELIQARKHRLQIKRSQLVQKMMFIVGRKSSKSSTSATTTSKRQMFEQMNAEIDRLQKENSRLNVMLLETRKNEQFEWSKDELLFASKSLVEFNLLADEHYVVNGENESKCANVKKKKNDDSGFASNNRSPAFSQKDLLEESLVRSFQDKHVSV